MARGPRAQSPACEPSVPFCRVIVQRTSELLPDATSVRHPGLGHASVPALRLLLGEKGQQQCTDFPD
jgi:hypothetical protein